MVEKELSDAVREGVRNLVHNCAEITQGETVLIINGYGVVDRDLADLIATTVREAGADYHELWAEPMERNAKEIPKVLLGAMKSADKILTNYAINRVLMESVVKGEGLVHVDNWFRTPEMMATEHARFHTGMVRALCARLEEICAAGERWSVAAPNGTSISGAIARESDVADSFFAQDAAGGRNMIVFPGLVYTPTGSLGAEGTVVANHVNVQSSSLWEEPAFISVADNKVRGIEGGEEASRLERQVDANVGEFGDKALVLDSWHGGINAYAASPTLQDPSFQWQRMGSSSAMMHFHVGSIKAPLSPGVWNQTLEIDGRRIIEEGKLLFLDDAVLLDARRQFGLAEQ